jgi:signal transduction histidine kinase
LADPSLLIDASERILYANQAYERATGYPSADVEGQSLSELVEPDGSNADAASTLCRSTHGFLSMRAFIRPLAGGDLRLMLLEEGSAPRGTIVERLSARMELKGEFLARLSHELRTPLTAVQEGLDLVLDGLTGPLNEQQTEFLELARRNVHRLNRLVTDTLELDSLKRGHIPAPRERIDLAAIVRQGAGRYDEVEIWCPPESVWVEADAEQIDNVLQKLIQNAIRHSPHSRVQVAVRCAGGESTVEVADSGPGIPADKLAEIFGEFEQLSIGPGRTVGGVGLGLTIAKLIVEQHGGRIWAESEPGSGARFYFALKTCLPTAEKLS